MAAGAAPARTGETAGALTRRIAARLRAGFAAAGREGTPDLDARFLVAHALCEEPAGLAANADRPVAPDAAARVDALADRRNAGEPGARIIGAWGFWSPRLLLSPETLVPRPDTETVVEAALSVLDGEGRRGAALRLLDLGTGTGAILLALLSELPAAEGIGIDLAEGAARTARANAAANGLAGRASFLVGDWGSAVSGRFDVVVANPPYIPSGEIPRLQLEVRDHDPHIALDGGADGFSADRVIIGDLGRLLSPSGHAFIEVGAGQADGLTAIARRSGFEADTYRDLAGIERVVGLRRPATAGSD